MCSIKISLVYAATIARWSEGLGVAQTSFDEAVRPVKSLEILICLQSCAAQV